MATKKYLDNEGLLYFWQKLKSYFVAKEDGKGLSTNDYTTVEKIKLQNIAENAQVNVQSDWNAESGDAAILNKPNIPTKTSEITNDSGFITTSDIPEGAAASTTAPKMNGVATVGTELAFARGDHIHPTDTSRASADDLSSHTGDANIHITSAERTAWNKVSDKVDKVDGKGLSTNDYVTDDKNKLANIEAGAQVNTIETVKVNGTAQSISDKSVDIIVPTNNNQLTNGAGYQTASDVEGIITSKGYATSGEVASAVANANHLKRSVVEGTELPNVSGADTNTIYMLPITDASGNNKFTEWMVVNGAWEKTGDSDVDLTGYQLSADLVSITNTEIDTITSTNS